MLQTIPLAPALGIHVDFVIKSIDSIHLKAIQDFVPKGFSTKPRELQIVQRPVELDMAAGFDFGAGGTDNGWGQQVDCCSQ